MIHLYADVYDPTGTTVQGAGYVRLASLSVSRVLDGPGTVSCTFMLGDGRGITEMQPKRIVRLYVDDEQQPVREVAAFVIDSVNDLVQSGQRKVSGKDTLSLLANKNSGFGLNYDDADLETIVSSLAGFAGWTVAAETGVDAVSTSIRFNLTSMLTAIDKTLRPRGFHYRTSATFKEIEVGVFGSDTGLVARHMTDLSADAYNNDHLLLIETMTLQTEAKDIVNRLIPVGQGAGDAKLTLEGATRTGISTQPSPAGGTTYYVEDAASVAQYGAIERVLDTGVSPISASSSDVLAAKNTMKDIADVELARRCQPVEQYRLTVRKAPTIRPGDKIRVDYQGEVQQINGDTTIYRVVSGLFWVLSVTERWGLNGGGVDLEISTIDEFTLDTSTKALVGGLDSIRAQNIGLQTTQQVLTKSQVLRIGAGFSEAIPLRIDDSVFDLVRCIVYVRSRPLRSNIRPEATSPAQTAAAGGDHNHRVLALTSVSGFPGTSPQPYLGRESDGGSFAFFKLDSNARDLWTYDSSDVHSHAIDPITVDIEYGMYDDTQTPDTIGVSINGVDRTVALGGAWASGGGATAFQFECSDLIKQATLQQEHDITFNCTSGQGELVVDIVATVLTTTVKPI